MDKKTDIEKELGTTIEEIKRCTIEVMNHIKKFEETTTLHDNLQSGCFSSLATGFQLQIEILEDRISKLERILN